MDWIELLWRSALAHDSHSIQRITVEYDSGATINLTEYDLSVLNSQVLACHAAFLELATLKVQQSITSVDIDDARESLDKVTKTFFNKVEE